MPDEPRLIHRVLSSGEHSITSPDVKGLCAVADTEADARVEAYALLAKLNSLGVRAAARAPRVKHYAA